MSYDVYVNCHCCGSDLMNGHNNMTSNVAPVWDALGCEIRDWEGRSGIQVLPLLASALRQWKDMLPYEREELDAKKRGDGSWGKVEHAIEFLERIRDACCRDPFATVSVSR